MIRQTLILAVAALLLAACGTAATPEWAEEAQGTQAALAETSAYETSVAPTATPTEAPTETTVPPTATSLPPTATTEPATSTPEEADEATATSTPIEASASEDNGGGAEVDGDAEHGQELFNEMRAEVGFACATCHNAESTARLIGPGLQGIGEAAETRVEDMDAVAYLHQSIVEPNAHIAPAAEGEPPYPESLMPQIYEEVFTEQEINDLVAYLLTV